MAEPATVQLAKRVALYAGAALSAITLASVLVSLAINLIVVPQIEKVMAQERQARVASQAEERVARTEADERLSVAIQRLSTDRLDLIAVLEEAPGPARKRLIREIRSEWSRRN